MTGDPAVPPGDAAALDPATWERLRAAAREAATRAYAPYSGVRVGAAALVDDGRVVTGCNVENASIGLTTCAENGVASALAVSGGGRLVALAVVAGDGAYLAPCGRCRQVLFEFGGPGLLISTGPPTAAGGDAVVTLGDLLPGAFGPDDVSARRDTSVLSREDAPKGTSPAQKGGGTSLPDT